MNTQNEEGALAFSTCTVCYLNDFTCNAIKDAEAILKGSDKETLKIFGAANKRAKAYLDGFDKCIWDSIDWWANYCMYLDEESAKAYNNLYDAVLGFFSERLEEDAPKYAIAEVLKMTIAQNNRAIKRIVETLRKFKIDDEGLLHDLMDDTERVVRNLEKWVTRKVPKETIIELYKDKDVEACGVALYDVLISPKRHEEAKKFAENEEVNNGK